MPSQNRLNLLVPGGIGTAGTYKNIANRFVRSEPKQGSLSDGLLLLQMTSDELHTVHNIVAELQCGYPDGFSDLELQYRFLRNELEGLLCERRNTSVLNFTKRNHIRRTTEGLYRTGDRLYTTVKAVTSHVEKELQAFRIANAQVKEVEATEIAANEQVMGISLDRSLPVDPEQASTFTHDSFFTALDELSTDSESMYLGDADDHSPPGNISASGVVSGAEHMMPEASSVLASRVDSATVDGWLQDRPTHGSLAGGAVPGFGAAPRNGTSSSASPVNRTRNQTIPLHVPDPVGGDIPDSSSHPGVQNVPSGSSPTVPHPPSNYLAPGGAGQPALQYILYNYGNVIFQDSMISANAANPVLMKDESNNGPPIFQHAGLGAQGAAYPSAPTPRLPARHPGEPNPPPSGPPGQSSAFHDFSTTPDASHDSNLYTTIDGEIHGQHLEVPHFIQTAEVLRETTKSHVIKIVQEFSGLSDSEKEVCIKLVRDVPILPGLVAHIYIHLVVCPRRGRVFKDDWKKYVLDLEREVNYWQRRGGTQCVLFYDMVKSSLTQILNATKVLNEQDKCNSALLNGTMLIEQDIQNLAALAALCITGSDKDKILRAEESEAAVLTKLLLALLDAGVELDVWCRRCLFDALISLTKVTGHCPPGLYLNQDIISDLVPFNQGGFGLVYKGNIGSRVVAVKYLIRVDHAGSHDDSDKDLCKEAIVWRHLRHPNCLPLYGVYRIHGMDGPPALVSPWMHHGTLFNYLKSTPTANRTVLILDMVRGLHYLHSMRPHVAHRDIKPDNILVTKQGRACLADFGLVSVFDMDPQFRTATAQLKMVGTPNYTAPEILVAETEEDKRKVNKRLSDMYSLGCTIYATYTRQHPFHGVRPEVIRARVASGERPPFPDGQISLDMWSLVVNLWSPKPSARLTTKMVRAWMEIIAENEGIDPSLPGFEEEWLWQGSQTGGPLFVA